ncbi:Tyrosine decarboxylase 1 [Grifola frondosa]|uniref:Tyrosine decarboxylase 1 n=1 Tax=Grifola frondosa TaxID=5627 RepID=A0A1C7LS39_GRIFR|nr:Tyrosine decarboxylase 1 [Grifola frondosa]
MDIEGFRKAGYQAIDRICDYYYSLQKLPVVAQVQPGYLAKVYHTRLDALAAPQREQSGIQLDEQPSMHRAGDGRDGLGGETLGLGDHFMNSSAEGGGVIQTTASEACIVVCVAARSLYMRQHPDAKLEELVIYTTSQTHSLGVKAGLVLGLEVRIIDVKAEDDFALRGEALRTTLETDVGKGKRPFIIIATVGTTSSGAVDRLGEIGEVLKEYPSVWLHVDAAWAGVTMACPEYRGTARLEDINKFATSFGTNFHKWGLINFDASMLWVRNRKHLTDALDVTPEILRSQQHIAGVVIDYRNWHLGLGRRFRSLKVWFVLRSYGVEGFRKHIREGIALNEYFASLLRDFPDISIVTPPSFALTVFRLVPCGSWDHSAPITEELLNMLNRAFYARLSARSDILLTQTVLNGMFCVRFAVGATRTTVEHIDIAWEIIKEEALIALKDSELKVDSSQGVI